VLRVGEIEEGAEGIQDRRVGRNRGWQREIPAGVVEAEVGITHNVPTTGGDFNHLGLAVQEIKRYGFEGVAASGHTLVHRAPGTWLRVSAGLEDAKGCAPGGVTRNELVLLIEAVEEPVLEEGRA
jgi:hypothetical protein